MQEIFANHDFALLATRLAIFVQLPDVQQKIHLIPCILSYPSFSLRSKNVCLALSNAFEIAKFTILKTRNKFLIH